MNSRKKRLAKALKENLLKRKKQKTERVLLDNNTSSALCEGIPQGFEKTISRHAKF